MWFTSPSKHTGSLAFKGSQAKVELLSKIFKEYATELFGEPPSVDPVTQRLTGGSPPDIKKIEKILAFFGYP